MGESTRLSRTRSTHHLQLVALRLEQQAQSLKDLRLVIGDEKLIQGFSIPLFVLLPVVILIASVSAC